MSTGKFTSETGREAARAREYFTQEQITEGLMALIAWAGNATAAAEYLSDEKGFSVHPHTLKSWRRRFAPQYLELREKHADQLEKQLAHEYLDIAAQAGQGVQLAVEKAIERLDAGKDEDPGRTAANLARVAQSAVDKNRVLTDRPSRITETRGLEEILRSLAAKNILQLPEETERPDAAVDGAGPAQGD